MFGKLFGGDDTKKTSSLTPTMKQQIADSGYLINTDALRDLYRKDYKPSTTTAIRDAAQVLSSSVGGSADSGLNTILNTVSKEVKAPFDDVVKKVFNLTN